MRGAEPRLFKDLDCPDGWWFAVSQLASNAAKFRTESTDRGEFARGPRRADQWTNPPTSFAGPRRRSAELPRHGAVILSMANRKRTRESLLNIVERSITAERLVTELETAFTVAGGPPKEMRMDNDPELVPKRCNTSARTRPGWFTFHPGFPGVNGHIESFSNRLRKESRHRNHWNTLFEARVVVGDFKHDTITDTAIPRWC